MESPASHWRSASDGLTSCIRSRSSFWASFSGFRDPRCHTAEIIVAIPMSEGHTRGEAWPETESHHEPLFACDSLYRPGRLFGYRPSIIGIGEHWSSNAATM